MRSSKKSGTIIKVSVQLIQAGMLLGSYAPRYTVLPISWDIFTVFSYLCFISSTLGRWDNSAAIRSCLASFRVGTKQMSPDSHMKKCSDCGWTFENRMFLHSIFGCHPKTRTEFEWRLPNRLSVPFLNRTSNIPCFD